MTGTPHCWSRATTSGASTAGASAQPGSAPPRPHAAPITSTCRRIATSGSEARDSPRKNEGLMLSVESCSARSSRVKDYRMEGGMTAATKWQDWASFALGLWPPVSPWALGYSHLEAATANAAFMGLALALGSPFAVRLD